MYMVRGLYTAATGMAVQRNRMDVLTNNLVNAETTGFKKDTLVTSSFSEVMLYRINDPSVSIYGTNEVGPYNHGTHIDELFTDFAPGVLEQTGKSTDLAIEGEGFFAVETENGERYTRSGNFKVDGAGYLVTADGYYVLGENGRINVGNSDFTVSSNGTVTGASGETDRLRLVTFGDLGVLRKQGDNLYYAYGGSAAVNANGATVRQFAQENSNVNVADEMVNLLTLYRKYEAGQKIVSMTDDTMGMAANIGKVGS